MPSTIGALGGPGNQEFSPCEGVPVVSVPRRGLGSAQRGEVAPNLEPADARPGTRPCSMANRVAAARVEMPIFR